MHAHTQRHTHTQTHKHTNTWTRTHPGVKGPGEQRLPSQRVRGTSQAGVAFQLAAAGIEPESRGTGFWLQFCLWRDLGFRVYRALKFLGAADASWQEMEYFLLHVVIKVCT